MFIGFIPSMAENMPSPAPADIGAGRHRRRPTSAPGPYHGAGAVSRIDRDKGRVGVTDKLEGSEEEPCSWLRSVASDDYARWSYWRADRGSTLRGSDSREARPLSITTVLGPLRACERSCMATAASWRWSGPGTDGTSTPVQASPSSTT